jgi:phosphoglycerate-specific signal transduction histidine kinase
LTAQEQAQNKDAESGQGALNSQQMQSNDSPSFEDAELQKFAKVMKKIQTVQNESTKKIETAFSESSMSKQRFNKLYSARKNGSNQKAKNETKAETEEFKKLATQIQSIQQSNQKKMVDIVRKNDMTVQKFNQIVKAMRSNPNLGKKIQQMM